MDDQRVYREGCCSLTERDKIYLQILEVGLVSLRNAAYRGDVHYWKVEAEHLHNLPSLIGETNEARHEYYFEAERASYLDAVDSSNDDNRYALLRYRGFWEALAKLREQK